MKIISFLFAFAVVAHAKIAHGPATHDVTVFQAIQHIGKALDGVHQVVRDNHDHTKDVENQVSRLRKLVKAQGARILNLELKDPDEVKKRGAMMAKAAARIARAVQDEKKSKEAALP